MSRVPITRAIVSVSDKSGLDRLAVALHAAGVEIVSTGSTAAAIAAAGVPVTRVEEVTGFPECLGGRVKTLHPAVHAGLLADVRDPDQARQLAEFEIAPFQLLVSNLYPFEQSVVAGATGQAAVEQIDIGGPAMVRAAAKNHANVAVVTSPRGYGEIEEALAAGGFTIDQRRRLAARAYAHTANYDAAIASWFAGMYAPDETATQTGWPDVTAAVWSRAEVLRYGENPHQSAALYRPALPARPAERAEAGGGGRWGGGRGGEAANSGRVGTAGVANAEHLHGKAMSYNNYVDADAAWRTIGQFTQPCVAIVKHSNPCGIAVGTDITQAHREAHASDPVSAYGGVIAANRPVTAELAAQIAEIFTEVIIAPDFEEAAFEILSAKKNQRLLRCTDALEPGTEWRHISGGLLMQTMDTAIEPGDYPSGWRLVAGPAVEPDVLEDLEFAWRACRSVKSNAILLASRRASVGIGMGQVNRVDAARLAVARAGDRASGSVAASDAYFPFADGLLVLAEAGVQAIAEPGGSVRDAEVIEAAERAGTSLYFTGVRHFWH